jgi:hypothetical protein
MMITKLSRSGTRYSRGGSDSGNLSTEDLDKENEYSFLGDRIESDKLYTVYFTVKNSGGDESKNYFSIDRIEGLMPLEEGQVIASQREAEKAKVEAEKEAKAEAERKAREAKWNPNNLDRSQYKGIAVEDFAFDMAAGKLPAGSKVQFLAKFLTKPTGTAYRFQDISLAINLTSNHNFVRDMPSKCFETSLVDLLGLFGSPLLIDQQAVRIYVTVQKPGQAGECSVDIVVWND